MPRYSRSNQPQSESQPHSRNRSRSAKVTALRSTTKTKQKPFWQNSLVYLGAVAALVILIFPFWQENKIIKVISIHASDASDSGIVNPKIPQDICKARAEKLVAGDQTIDFAFSDRAEPTRNEIINQTTDLRQQCQDLFTDKKERPKQIGESNGTDPISIISRIENAIATERAKGNKKPVMLTMWLDEAEPTEGKSAYDFNDFQKRVEGIVSARGRVAIIGTKGELRENLEKRFAKNPAISLCTAKDSATCISDVFESVRTLPK